MVILTGASDIDKLSYFVRYNDKESLNAWPDPKCNTFEGTDGSMFPPRLVRAMQPVFAYKAEACRQIKFVFKEKSYVSNRHILGVRGRGRNGADGRLRVCHRPRACAPTATSSTGAPSTPRASTRRAAASATVPTLTSALRMACSTPAPAPSVSDGTVMPRSLEGSVTSHNGSVRDVGSWPVLL